MQWCGVSIVLKEELKMKFIMKKATALAVSGVLTMGMAASLPVSYLASAEAESNVIFQAECENLEGQHFGHPSMQMNFRGILVKGLRI